MNKKERDSMAEIKLSGSSYTLFTSLLDKVALGVSNDKILPLTSQLGIKVSKDGIVLLAFNGLDTIGVSSGEITSDEPIDVAVNASAFINIIKHGAVPDAVLSFGDKALKVVFDGRSSYSLPYPIDGASPLKFPTPSKDGFALDSELDLAEFKKVVSLVGAGLSKRVDLPDQYRGVYFGSGAVIATDSIKAAVHAAGLGNKSPIILRADSLKLIALIDSPKADLYTKKDGDFVTDYLVDGGNVVVSGHVLKGGETYSEDRFLALKNNVDGGSSISIPAKELKNALHRIAFAIDPGLLGTVRMSIGKGDKELSIKSASGYGHENVDIDDVASAPLDKGFNLALLSQVIDAVTADSVKIDFGDKNLIVIDNSDTDWFLLSALIYIEPEAE